MTRVLLEFALKGSFLGGKAFEDHSLGHLWCASVHHEFYQVVEIPRSCVENYGHQQLRPTEPNSVKNISNSQI